VIAYGKGGALETVRGTDANNPTGIFFYDQTVADVIEAVNAFELRPEKIAALDCRENALRFSIDCFVNEFKIFVEESWQQFKKYRV